MRAARMVRESFAGAADREQLLALGKLLARRRAIVRKWRDELATQNRTLRQPNCLIPEADYAADLLHRVSSSSRHEWEDIHDALTSRGMLRTFETLRDRFADDVARHELQHRFDGQLSKDCVETTPCASLAIPEAVRRHVGPADGRPVLLGSMPGRVTVETSAYLAQMTVGMPKMTLLSLLRTVLDREAWGDVYCNTTLVLLDVLGKQLHYDDHLLGHEEARSLVAGGAVQRANVAALVGFLFEHSDDELRATAAKAWSDLFGREVPKAVIRNVHQGPRWRH
jgi:hypothetical protein